LDADGNLSEHWAEYLRKLMHIAHKIHRISDEELEQGLNETLMDPGSEGAAADGKATPPGAESLPEEIPPPPDADPGP
jgi:hypothetical protein